jgi:hypothetical protein
MVKTGFVGSPFPGVSGSLFLPQENAAIPVKKKSNRATDINGLIASALIVLRANIPNNALLFAIVQHDSLPNEG